MRSTLEIIIAAKDQQPATEEELRLAVVALSHMLHGVERECRSLFEGVLEGKPSAKMRAEFCRREEEVRFRARKLPMTEYLGPDYTPGTPENERLRKMAANVFKKAAGEKL